MGRKMDKQDINKVMGKEMANIDIILATHNHLSLTISAVEALYANTSIPFKLIVVDDSTDRLTPLYFEELQKTHQDIKFIHSETPYSHGNQIIQIGIDNSETPIVGYLGNSTRVEPEWIDVAWDIINREPSVGIIGFKLVYDSGVIEHAGMYWTPEMPHHMNFGVNQPGHRYTFIREVDMVGWALVLLKKEALSLPLDTTTYLGFRGYDDCDTCLEVRKKGWKIIYCGLGCAYHSAGATRHSNSDSYAIEHEHNRQTFLHRWGATDKAIGSEVITRVYV